MENRQINNNLFIQQQELYLMINELNEKYKILEKKNKENEELIKVNKNNIIMLNKNLNIVKNFYEELKKKSEKDINDLKEKINSLDNVKKNDKIDNIFKENLDNIRKEIEEKNKYLEKLFNELSSEIKEIRLKLNFKNQELKIDESEEKNIFQSYENLLAKILSQQDIDNKSYERMKIIMEKLIINNISPYDLTNIYFKDLYNLQDFNDKENTEKLCNMQMKICDTIENIINELIKPKK